MLNFLRNIGSSMNGVLDVFKQSILNELMSTSIKDYLLSWIKAYPQQYVTKLCWNLKHEKPQSWATFRRNFWSYFFEFDQLNFVFYLSFYWHLNLSCQFNLEVLLKCRKCWSKITRLPYCQEGFLVLRSDQIVKIGRQSSWQRKPQLQNRGSRNEVSTWWLWGSSKNEVSQIWTIFIPPPAPPPIVMLFSTR